MYSQCYDVPSQIYYPSLVLGDIMHYCGTSCLTSRRGCAYADRGPAQARTAPAELLLDGSLIRG